MPRRICCDRFGHRSVAHASGRVGWLRARALSWRAVVHATPSISFARGAPSLDIIAVEDLRAAADRALRNDPGGSFAYGTGGGYVPLREWIAESQQVQREQVLVTNGSMQADAFLFELMVKPGDAVVVESPTYDRTLLNLRGRGADVHAFALEGDGIDAERLATALGQGLRPKLAHIIPNFQNPAGYTLSAAKRARLLELAIEHDFTIFEDDPYVAIRFEGEPLATMLSADDAGRVVYASSFSKTVCPGIRVGYLVGPQAVIKQIQTIATNTYISPNMVAQSIVNQFARSGRMDGAIATVKNALRERRDTLVAALERELPEARFQAPQGGYFMWVELPEAVDVAELERAAAEREVIFVKGTDFLLEGGSNTLRLAYSGVNPAQIEQGISRLAEAVRSLGVAAA
jgi:2-aminoadipate transaminase